MKEIWLLVLDRFSVAWYSSRIMLKIEALIFNMIVQLRFGWFTHDELYCNSDHIWSDIRVENWPKAYLEGDGRDGEFNFCKCRIVIRR